MSTIGGHGFGAKVATATAINHMTRFTGVMCHDGGPLNHLYYESYQEMVSYIELVKNLNLSKMNAADVLKEID
jgi:pimeloyl-ACP methyl ester carboxylesterase